MCASAAVSSVEAQLKAALASASAASLDAALQEALVRALLDLQHRVAGAGVSSGCTATVALQVGGQAGRANSHSTQVRRCAGRLRLHACKSTWPMAVAFPLRPPSPAPAGR